MVRNTPRFGASSILLCGGLAVMTVLSGCASLAPSPVTPEEIPGLQSQALQEPGNGSVHLRLGAALMSAGRCDEAMSAADRGRALLPTDPLGPLVIGRCLERDRRFDEAIALYSSFIEANAGSPGIAAVEGQKSIALRRQAEMLARSAIENETNLGPSDPERVGVLPFIVDGDTTYHPLQVGLANMLTTDLALLQRFPMVERVRLDALLGELQLPPELVDRATAARTGRLLGASRMVLGTVSIPSEAQTLLTSNIVLETGEVVEPFRNGGDLRDLLSLEKDLAVRTAEALGYQLSEAEIQRIRENAPANLNAFLAFSRGLMAEDIGDFEAAAAHYAEALRADPTYRDARQHLEGSVGAGVLSEAGEGEITAVAAEADRSLSDVTGSSEEAVGTATGNILSTTIESSISDLASHQAERATDPAGNANPSEVVPDPVFPPPPLQAIILIIINIPRY